MCRNVLFPLFVGMGSIVSGSVGHADNITINLQGSKNHAQYIQQGQTQQLNVVVTVGDTVNWVNPTGNSNHTATSELRDSTTAHAQIFDVAVNADGQPHAFSVYAGHLSRCRCRWRRRQIPIPGTSSWAITARFIQP